MSQSSRLSGLLQAIISVAILTGGLAAFLLLGRAEAQPKRQDDAPPAQVEVATVVEHTEEVEFSVDGVVTPFQDIEIAAEVTGRIVEKSKNCRVGRTVRQGELLLRIDPRDYEHEVKNLEEQLKQAENNLLELAVQIESAQAQVGLAKEEVGLQNRFLERTETLAERRATTQAERDTALRNVLAARISLQTHLDQQRLYEASRLRLLSAVEHIKSLLARARDDLQRTEIRAPIDGVITRSDIEEQSYLQKGTSVFVVRDISKLDVRCSLQASEMYWLWDAQSSLEGANAYDFPETPVTVVYKLGGQQYAWDGVLARYDGADIDARTRMIPCRVHVENPRQAHRLGDATARVGGRPPTLMVGMFVELRIRVRPRERLLRLPVEAIQPGNQVWLVEQGLLAQRAVRIANTMDDGVLIYADPAGVAAGSQVVVSPMISPLAGTPVQQRGAL